MEGPDLIRHILMDRAPLVKEVMAVEVVEHHSAAKLDSSEEGQRIGQGHDSQYLGRMIQGREIHPSCSPRKFAVASFHIPGTNSRQLA